MKLASIARARSTEALADGRLIAPATRVGEGVTAAAGVDVGTGVKVKGVVDTGAGDASGDGGVVCAETPRAARLPAAARRRTVL
jgi:hypothetical protein